MATFTQKQIDIFNGDGYASPMGSVAKEIAFGTALETLESRVAELEDGDVAITTLDLSAAATGDATVALADNLAAAWTVKQSSTAYLTFKTTNDAERVTLGKLMSVPVQTIDMADAQVALVYGTASAGQVQITGQILFVDANSGTTEDLLLPAEATSTGLFLVVVNTGGEDIVVKEDSDTTTICTCSTTEVALVFCDGTSWKGGVVKTT